MVDILVIGAGLAGICAALRGADAGLSVRIVAKGLGALHWSAASIDVLGYLPGASNAVDDPFASFAALPSGHPYRLLGGEEVRRALVRFQQVTSELGLPYAGAAELARNTLLPSPVGAVRPVLMAPLAQLQGDTQEGGPMLIAGFTGLRDFYPRLIAENLSKQGVPARAAFLPWEILTNQRDRNSVQLATILDETAAQRRLAQALKPLVQAGERIGLPAILGMDRHAECLAEIEAATGARAFEIPTLPPSVPGVRIYQALRRRLLAAGVRIEPNMEIAGFHAEGGQIEWVETSTSSRPLRHRARTFVLATGGVLGGGFSSDPTGRFWETVFGLPLTVAQERAAWFRPQFLDPAGQPVFRGGVRVDARFQPLGDAGEPVYRNLWAAGGALAEADPILERSLEGIAIATGMKVGEAITHALAPVPA